MALVVQAVEHHMHHASPAMQRCAETLLRAFRSISIVNEGGMVSFFKFSYGPSRGQYLPHYVLKSCGHSLRCTCSFCAHKVGRHAATHHRASLLAPISEPLQAPLHLFPAVPREASDLVCLKTNLCLICARTCAPVITAEPAHVMDFPSHRSQPVRVSFVVHHGCAVRLRPDDVCECC